MGRHIMDAGTAVLLLVALFAFTIGITSIASWAGAIALADKALEWATVAFTAILVLLRPGGKENGDK